jgi:hypothetical protein
MSSWIDKVHIRLELSDWNYRDIAVKIRDRFSCNQAYIKRAMPIEKLHSAAPYLRLQVLEFESRS